MDGPAVEQILLALITMAIAYGSKSLHGMMISVQELNTKMGFLITSVKDHEHRLRVIEKHTKE